MNKMYKDSVANLASALTKKNPKLKPKSGKTTRSGTADTMARRAGEQGALSPYTASNGPDNQYRTTGSSFKKMNDGKRIVEMKDTEGLTRSFYSYGDGQPLVEVLDSYKDRQKSSDAIVKPRTRR